MTEPSDQECEFLITLTFIIQQDVLWFQVPVDDPLLVQMLHALDDLSGVITGSGLGEAGVILVHVIDVIPAADENKRSVQLNIEINMK